MKKVTLTLIAMGFSMAASQAVMAADMDDVTMTVVDMTAQSVADMSNEIELPDADDVNEVSDEANEVDEADDDAADAEDDADEADDDADEAEEDGSDVNDDANEVDDSAADSANDAANDVN